jgi:hypothetical protein
MCGAGCRAGVLLQRSCCVSLPLVVQAGCMRDVAEHLPLDHQL